MLKKSRVAAAVLGAALVLMLVPGRAIAREHRSFAERPRVGVYAGPRYFVSPAPRYYAAPAPGYYVGPSVTFGLDFGPSYVVPPPAYVAPSAPPYGDGYYDQWGNWHPYGYYDQWGVWHAY